MNSEPSIKPAASVAWFLGMLVSVLWLASGARAGEPEKPGLIRLSWTDDPRTTMTVIWQASDAGQKASVVRYGPTAQYGKEAKGSAYQAFAGAFGMIHEVALTGLKPGTTYHYCVGDGGASWSGDRTFTTAPERDEPFVFHAFADTKTGVNTLAKVLELADKPETRLVLYGGDAVSKGGAKPEWVTWFKTIEPFASRIPIMVSTGNHEVNEDPKLDNYQLFNVLPKASGSELYYSFDYSYVHFVSLDTNNLSDAQGAWLEKDLAAAKKPWKVAVFHSPAFSSGTVHGSSRAVQKKLCPILDKHHVDLVFQGDDHIYERCKPINYTKSPSAPVGSYKEGTCYIISAGAGAGLYDVEAGKWWSEVTKTKTFHTCRVRVEEKKLTVEATDLTGNIFDRVTIEK
jgi:predicted MPP superfamily phosphohydrolase